MAFMIFRGISVQREHVCRTTTLSSAVRELENGNETSGDKLTMNFLIIRCWVLLRILLRAQGRVIEVVELLSVFEEFRPGHIQWIKVPRDGIAPAERF